MTDSLTPKCPLSPKGSWRTYTPADGLAALHVEHIVEDRKGRLWFATCSGGISCFDGDGFRTFTVQDGLVSDLVFFLLCDRRGRIWCGTMTRGICWYEDGAFHRFEDQAWCSRGNFICLFEEEDGRIWFAGDSGVGYYDGRQLCDLSTAYHQCCGHSPANCWGIAQDRKGHLWFGGEDLVRYDGKRFSRCGAEHDLDPSLRGFYTVARDGDGVLWVGRGDRLWRYDRAVFQLVPVALEGSVRKLQTDRDGRLWICSSGGGVLRHDDRAFHAFTPRDGLVHPMVNGMCQDREGQFWFATWGGGVSCFDPNGCRILYAEEGPSAGEVHALVVDSGKVRWASLQERLPERERYIALGAWTDETRTALEPEPELKTNLFFPPVLTAAPSGALWIGSSAGLYHYDGRACRQRFPVEEEVGFCPVSALATDAEGQRNEGIWEWAWPTSTTMAIWTC